MANTINAGGITIQTLAEIISDIVNGTDNVSGLKEIYGTDINVDSNSPDGQLVNILALSKRDVLDLVVQLYNSRDPDQAVGAALDAISQLCGISRQGGTYTKVVVDVTADRSLTLYGLDQTEQAVYTVADANGNQFQLISTAALSAGANALNFRAVQIGNVQVQENTLNVPVTVILGVTGANNPAVPYEQGVNQESDATLRLRRQRSVRTPSQGYFQAMLGALLDLDGVASALVLENNSASTDADGIPSHSIWVIVDGGDSDEIASAIYNTRNAGCGMKGDEVVQVTQVDGSLFPIRFDFGGTEDLLVQLHIDSVNGATIDQAAIADYLAENYTFQLNEPANVSAITALILQFNPNLVVSDAGVSADGVAYTSIAYPTTKKDKFVLTAENIAFL